MKKGTIIKGVILGLAICGSTFIINSNSFSPTNSIHSVYADTREVAITDAKLKSAICRNLGKNVNDKLYSDEFLKATDYNPDPETTKINRRCIDLSNSGVTDIKELLQFELPESLVAIDLSDNNLTNDDIKNIDNLLALTTTDIEYTYDKDPDNNIVDDDIVKIPIRTDWDTQILKVNLNNNNIDLDALSTEELSNPKFIYGIQNINLHPSGMNLYDEVKDIKYYFKESPSDNDHVYIASSYIYNQHKVDDNISFKPNQILPLINPDKLGEYEIYIGNPKDTETGYFHSIPAYEVSFKVFTAEINSSYSVERKAMFNLQPSDVIITGLNGDVDKDIKDASTNTIGLKDVNVVITNIDTSRNVSLQFLVKDTIAPTISLIPNNTNVIYWRQNKEFVDPGYKGYDSGDDISELVNVDASDLDITKLGTYTIKYNLTDLAGNPASEVTRMVVVQEQVLDEITLRTTTQDLIVGQDIVLVVEPSGDIDIDRYTDFHYTWYLNGKAFKTTEGDNTSGKSTTVINLDNTSIVDITVELHAKQKLDNADIYISSQKLQLQPKLADNNTTIIVAMIVALAIVLGVFIGSAIHKAHKSKKTSKKSKSVSPQNTNIQVIKNYPDNNNTSNDNK